MELYFQHNNEKILNFNDVARREITKTYRLAERETGSSYEAVSYIADILLDMYSNEEQSYGYYTNVMLTTTFMMLENTKMNNLSITEDLISYNSLITLLSNPEELIYFIESKAGIIEDLVRYTVVFDELSVLGKRTVVQNNKNKYQELLKISPIFGLDVLRYSTPGSPEEYLGYFIETLDTVVLDPDLVIEDIINYMKHLYLYDKEAYIKNFKKMSKIFYIWEKYQKNINELDNEDIIKYLSIIEQNTIEQLVDISIQDDNLLYYVIDGYCNNSTRGGLLIKNKYISEEDVYSNMKDQIPESLKENKQKIKK